MPYFYYGGFSSSYLLLVLPVLLFSMLAQEMVQHSFKKYNQISNARRMTGYDAARLILDTNGLTHVRIERIAGHLTDHYDPKTNVIRLSESVYGTASIAAVGVAAHEAGHAVQYAVGYFPIKIRAAIIPVTQFASQWGVWLCVIGVMLSFGPLAYLGFFLYMAVAFFQLVTLPVEFNASARAMQALRAGGSLTGEELGGARKVLTAAAMTYVAALASALVQLFRLWLIIGGNRRRDD